MVIVQGGPGTGKTVVVVNLLAAFTQTRRNARYGVEKMLRETFYAAKLTGTFKKTHINKLVRRFRAHSLIYEINAFDNLIVDEAHRRREVDCFPTWARNQVKELIQATLRGAFFVDDDQRVTMADVGHSDELRKWAQALNADVTELALQSQFLLQWQ